MAAKKKEEKKTRLSAIKERIYKLRWWIIIPLSILLLVILVIALWPSTEKAKDQERKEQEEKQEVTVPSRKDVSRPYAVKIDVAPEEATLDPTQGELGVRVTFTPKVTRTDGEPLPKGVSLHWIFQGPASEVWSQPDQPVVKDFTEVGRHRIVVTVYDQRTDSNHPSTSEAVYYYTVAGKSGSVSLARPIVDSVIAGGGAGPVVCTTLTIEFKEGDKPKGWVLNPDSWSPWIVTPLYSHWRVDVQPDLGFEIKDRFGRLYTIGPGQRLDGIVLPDGNFQLRGKSRGQIATITVSP